MRQAIRRIIPDLMERLVAERDLAAARQAMFDPNSPRWHAYAAEIRGYDDQIERLEATTAELAAKRQAVEDARRNPARAA